MTGDLLTLSTREMDTLAIIMRLAERRMTQAEAARRLGLRRASGSEAPASV